MSEISAEENAGGTEIASATCVFNERMPASIAKALVVAQRAVKPVKKTGYNKHAKYAYATMDDLSVAMREACNSAGLSIAYIDVRREDMADGERRVAATPRWTEIETGDAWLDPPLSVVTEIRQGMPADKAEAAALSYLRGSHAMASMQIPREDAEDAGAVDQRDDASSPAPRNDGAPGKLSECATPAQLLAWCSSRAAQIKSANEERRAEAHGGIVEAAKRVGGDAAMALAKAGLP